MPRIIKHSYNFFSSRTPNPKLLTAKFEGTGTNPHPRIRPLFGICCVLKSQSNCYMIYINKVWFAFQWFIISGLPFLKKIIP